MAWWVSRKTRRSVDYSCTIVVVAFAEDIEVSLPIALQRSGRLNLSLKPLAARLSSLLWCVSRKSVSCTYNKIMSSKLLMPHFWPISHCESDKQWLTAAWLFQPIDSESARSSLASVSALPMSLKRRRTGGVEWTGRISWFKTGSAILCLLLYNSKQRPLDAIGGF